jgi:hypothetical protein
VVQLGLRPGAMPAGLRPHRSGHPGALVVWPCHWDPAAQRGACIFIPPPHLWERSGSRPAEPVQGCAEPIQGCRSAVLLRPAAAGGPTASPRCLRPDWRRPEAPPPVSQQRDPEPCTFKHGSATAVALADMPVAGGNRCERRRGLRGRGRSQLGGRDARQARGAAHSRLPRHRLQCCRGHRRARAGAGSAAVVAGPPFGGQRTATTRGVAESTASPRKSGPGSG